MSNISKPFTFSPNTSISSSQVNANFDTVYNAFNGGIDATNLATDAVVTSKIADLNVTTAKINDSAVTTAKINDGAVTPVKWTNPYKFSAYRSADLAALGATVKFPFNAENYDTNSNFDTTNNRYTAPVNGFYRFSACVVLAFAGSGYFQIYLYKNGSRVATGSFGFFSAGGSWNAVLSRTLQLNAGDYIEVHNGASGAATFLGGPAFSHFDGELVSQT